MMRRCMTPVAASPLELLSSMFQGVKGRYVLLLE